MEKIEQSISGNEQKSRKELLFGALAKERLKELRKNNLIYRLVLNEKQEAFSLASYTDPITKEVSQIPNRIIWGGNKLGKTYVLCAECTAYALGFRPWLDPSHPMFRTQFQKKTMILYRAPNFGEVIMKKVIPTFREMIPEEELLGRGYIKNTSGNITKILFKNGNEIHFGSYGQETDDMEGLDWEVIAYDEPPTHDIYLADTRGLVANNGHLIMGMTLLKEPWITEQIIDRADGKNYFQVYGDMEDNLGHTDKNGVFRGHLTRQGIDIFVGRLDSDEIELRKKGKPSHLFGRIYDTFSKEIHTFDPAEHPEFQKNNERAPFNWPMYQVLDPHSRKPSAAIWASIDPQGDIWVWMEYPFGLYHKMKYDERVIEDYKRLWKEMEYGYSCNIKYIDNVRGNMMNSYNKMTIKQMYALPKDEYSRIYIDAQTKPWEASREAVLDGLYYKKQDGQGS